MLIYFKFLVYDHSAHHRDDDDDNSSSHDEKDVYVAELSRVFVPAEPDDYGKSISIRYILYINYSYNFNN